MKFQSIVTFPIIINKSAFIKELVKNSTEVNNPGANAIFTFTCCKQWKDRWASKAVQLFLGIVLTTIKLMPNHAKNDQYVLVRLKGWSPWNGNNFSKRKNPFQELTQVLYCFSSKTVFSNGLYNGNFHDWASQTKSCCMKTTCNVNLARLTDTNISNSKENSSWHFRRMFILDLHCP